MKKLVINMLVFGLFLTIILTIGTNTSWACKSAYMQITTSDEDPNDPAPEPVPEIVSAGKHIIYLDDDPNEPEEPNEPVPEIVSTGKHIIYLEDDPNEPEEPNEPVPE